MSILKIPKQSTGTAQLFQALARNMRALELYARRYALDEVEIQALQTALAVDKKYFAKTGLGNAVGTYTGWTHLLAQGGYGIWSFTVANFLDDANNMLWAENLDDDIHALLPQLFEYAGAGGSEAAGYFDDIFVYDGAAFSAEFGGAAGDLSVEGGAYQTLLSDTGDFLYIGDAATFTKVTFSLYQYGVGAVVKVEYYDTSTGWTTLTAAVDSLVDGTAAFTSDGNISFVAPAGWATTAINSITKYWIRISTTAALTQTPSAYAVLPGDSITTLLRLNSEEIRQEQWRWAYYSNKVYVTLPNNGASAYEGVSWIGAASSADNKKNFFVYRNALYARYCDAGWPAAITARVGASTFNGATGVTITHNIGHQLYCVTITPAEASGGDWFVEYSDNTIVVKTTAGVTAAFKYRISVY